MLCRCESHGWPEGTSNTYVARIKPAGNKNESIICGNCKQPGDIYLSDREFYQYQYDDRRLYSLKQKNILRIKLSDATEEVKTELTRDKNNPPEKDPESDSAADTDW